MFVKYRSQENGRVKAVIENRHKLAPRRSKSKTLDNMADAENWAAHTMDQMKVEHFEAIRKTTALPQEREQHIIFSNSEKTLTEHSSVAEIIEAFLKFNESSKKPASKTAISSLRMILKHNLAALPLSIIEYEHLESHCCERLEVCEPSTVRGDISTLGRAIRELKEANRFTNASLNKVSEEIILQHYPTLKKHGFIADSKRRHRRIANPQELGALLNAARDHAKRSRNNIRYDLLILLYIETLLRATELVSVRWADINFEKGTLTVRTGKNVRPGTLEVADSPREIPLTRRAKTILKSLNKAKSAASELVFDIGLKTITTTFPRITAKAGIVGLWLHDLRREGVSRMVEKGYSVLQIAAFTGHSDLSMIQEIYNAAQAMRVVQVLH